MSEPLPVALTAKVAVSLSPIRALDGWLEIDSELMANDAVVDVTERDTPFRVLVTTTWYEPSWVAIYDGRVAPEIGEELRYHWYDAAPEAVAETETVAPFELLVVSDCG